MNFKSAVGLMFCLRTNILLNLWIPILVFDIRLTIVLVGNENIGVETEQGKGLSGKNCGQGQDLSE